MKYSIPYSPGLLNWFRAKQDLIKDQIADIYFSDNQMSSNRYFEWKEEFWDELAAIREEFNVELHYVVNSSVYDNELYFPEKLQEFCDILQNVWDRGCRMLTFNNSILLRLTNFRNTIPPFVIKNSVNNKIQTLEQLQFWHENEFIADFILDRSLNRNLDELQRMSEYAKLHGLTITLLANEGCLPGCVWKQHCDNMICQYHLNTTDEVMVLKEVHGLLACANHYAKKPAETLKSPFIHPNNVESYEPYADVIKIAGRMVDITVLTNIIESYLKQSGHMTLFTFFATQISPDYKIVSFNDLLAMEHPTVTMNCKNACSTCNKCDKIYETIINGRQGR